MSIITGKDGTEIYFKDWGTSQPLFFHHGWALSAGDWDAQMIRMPYKPKFTALRNAQTVASRLCCRLAYRVTRAKSPATIPRQLR
jgi:pimeloyl-ACP methyl ester carboxylesterase